MSRREAWRVDKLTQGAIKIEALPAGQIVPAFEVLDATNKKVLDGWHAISYYWVGKNPAAALFAGPPGGPFGMDHMDWLGWLYVGGGLQMWRDFYQNDLKLNVIVWPAHPSSPQARQSTACISASASISSKQIRRRSSGLSSGSGT